MRASLEGTVALVTGASSGIGAATATALATQGAAVSLVARRKDRLEVLAETIRKQKGRAFVAQADISDLSDASEAVERTAAELGRIDTLVNCAGVMFPGATTDAPLSWARQMVSVNLLGLLYCTSEALLYLLRSAESEPRQVADVVSISSTLGRRAREDTAVYSATKHAVIGFSEALRQEVGRHHVRVAVVEPGAVDTELVGRSRPDVLRPEDIADVIVYIVTRPRCVAVSEILVRPAESA